MLHLFQYSLSFPKNPPYVPGDFNPVGSYRTPFSVPQNWQNKEIILHFGAVKSAFYCWVNGEKVGYSEGSKTPAEFNITQFLQEGENTLAVEVYRWSDGSYLEDQDFWRLSGIERDVYLTGHPKMHIHDFFAKSTLINQYQDGRLDLTIDLRNGDQEAVQDYCLKINLYDTDRRQVFSETRNFGIQGDSTNTRNNFRNGM